MDSGSIHTQIENHVATITFSHPASNSFPSSLLQKLVSEINTVSGQSNVHVVVLQSEGKTFCAGASFDELLSIDDLETGKNFFSGFANVINAIRISPKLFIARVQGKAVGGGVGLVAACDMAFATQDSAIKLSEIAIGIGPFVIEPVVSKKMGATATAQLTLSPTEWKSAAWALENGLYNAIVSADELAQTVTNKANELASYNPEALQEIKKIFWQNTQHWNDLLLERAAISGKLVLSEFTKNALNQFKKK